MLENYNRINQAAGLNVHIKAEGELQIDLCSVSASGNELELEKKVTGLSSLEQIRQHLPEKTPIALNLSGKGIFQKQISKLEAINQSNFSSVLPNGNPDDFYVQHFISGESSFISIIRKSEADRWISHLTQFGYLPLMLSLGPFVIDSITSQLNIYEGDFIVNGHQVSRNEHSAWTAYLYNETASSPFALKIGNEKIDEKLVIPCAAAFQLVLAGQIDPVHAEVDTLQDALDKQLESNKFKVQGFIILIAIFVLLLANFITLSVLNASNVKLQNQVSASAESDSSRNLLIEKTKKSEAHLKLLGWDGGINKSALIDQVCSLLPPDIELSSISVNPVDLTASRAENGLIFASRKLQLVGSSEEIIPVNEWIARIKTKTWVKNVQLESYVYDSELNKGKFLITIAF